VRIAAFAKERGCDGVLAVGGGSAIDVGKAASALIPNSHRDVYDFLEVVGKGMYTHTQYILTLYTVHTILTIL
jgi:alcohol dehydrogenase class IV